MRQMKQFGHVLGTRLRVPLYGWEIRNMLDISTILYKTA